MPCGNEAVTYDPARNEFVLKFVQGLSFHQLSLGSGYRRGPGRAKLVAAGTSFSNLLGEGRIRMLALHCVTLDEVGPAVAEILKQRTVGKIVMKL